MRYQQWVSDDAELLVKFDSKDNAVDIQIFGLMEPVE